MDIDGLRFALRKDAERFALRGGMAAANELRDILRADSHPRTGTPYTRGGVTTRRSAPGEAPAPETGRLRQSVQHLPPKARGNKVVSGAGMATPYAKPLELGTERMKPRPSVARLSEPRHRSAILDAAKGGLRNG